MKRIFSNPVRTVRPHHQTRGPGAAAVRSAVESLESRVFLSGNVSASVRDGALRIRGGGAANAIVVDQAGLGANQVRIAGTGGTSVNNRSGSVVLNGVTGGVDIRMTDAGDTVTLRHLDVAGNLSINLHGGANALTLDDVQVAKTVRIQNASKHSSTVLTRTDVGRDLMIGDGTGGQNVTLDGVDVGRNTRIFSGRRAATLTVDDSDFHGEVRVVTGAGADAVRIDAGGAASGPATLFRGAVWVSLSKGDDALYLGVDGESGNRSEFFQRAHLRGGAGYDVIRNFDPSTHGTQSWVSNFESSGDSSDATAPTVLSTDPGRDATGVARNKKVAATFSEAMDPQTIKAANVTLTGAGGAAVAGSVAYVGTTMTFTPAGQLAAGTTFTLGITTGAKDAAGNPLAQTFVRKFTTGSSSDATAPTVQSTNPSDLQDHVARNKTIAATFNESVDPLTVKNATFTLTGPGNTAVTGAVTYNGATRTASFDPTGNLAANTVYTARIVGGANGVKDLAGNALAATKVWTFETGTLIAQDPIDLGRAAPFAIMATATITGTGPSDINGDVGLNPGTAQGIPPSQIDGDVHVKDQAIIDAQADLLAAYDDAVSRTVTPQVLAGNLGGLTFTPGLYVNSSSVMISGAGSNNDVTLDAQGDPDAVFIFKMSTTLTAGVGSHVVLTGGAKAGNVYWQVGSSATLNTTTIFKGNILAAVSITVNSGSVIVGRLLGGANTNGAVTFNASTITVPAA